MEEKGSTPSPSYAARNWTPIHFPATYLSSVLGVAQPSEFCSMTARDFGWRQNACPRGVSDGGPQARKREVSGSVRDARQPGLLSSVRRQGASDSEPQDH